LADLRAGAATAWTARLREFRIRGVKTNIPFLDERHASRQFKTGQATTTLIDTRPTVQVQVEAQGPRDEAAQLPRDVIVNGNPHAKGYKPARRFAAPPIPQFDHRRPAEGHEAVPAELGPKKFCRLDAQAEAPAGHRHHVPRRASIALATRMRTYDMLAVADAVARRTPNLFSLEMWGGATFDTACASCAKIRGNACAVAREGAEHLFPDALPRLERRRLLELPGQRRRRVSSNTPPTSGMDIFRIFDSLNYLPNLKAAMERCEDTHAICEGGALLHRRHPRSEARQVFAQVLRPKLAKELERWARTCSHQGHGRPCAVRSPRRSWSRRSRTRSASRFTSTRTTPAA
jgi:pyruvate carboxylase